jgi:hypothetical protein
MIRSLIPQYFAAHAWLSPAPERPESHPGRTAQHPQAQVDLSLKLFWPATETHVRKYSAQEKVVVRETPEVFREVVEPYIRGFARERLAWYVGFGSLGVERLGRIG